MFDDVGRKIKIVAKVLFWVGFAFAICVWIAFFGVGVVNSEIGYFFVSFFAAALYGVFAWINSLFIYGFGQLIENSDILREIAESKEDKE